jgi:2,3,4,5-tetrahydropyridine-2-carboxylate N-succinyltransferase
MTEVAAYGIGLATSSAGRLLEVWFPRVGLDDADGTALGRTVGGRPGTTVVGADVRAADLPDRLGSVFDRLAAAAGAPTLRHDLERSVVVTLVGDLDAAPESAEDALLRLHLLSHRLVRPRGCSLDGLFGLLPNVVRSDVGPFDVERFDDAVLALAADGVRPRVTGVDRFPRMTDFVVPSGVRIADADRVRLGAHLAPGTVVMHEGFVNFDAGTLGASMVEGRISAGVVVGDGTDLGGGCSIMGTLSGGGTEVIRVGERCLIGANAGIGISLGDDCVVEAGLYVTAGTKVTLPDGRVVAARELSGASGMLLRRDSVSGRVELHARSGSWGGLNADLHAND